MARYHIVSKEVYLDTVRQVPLPTPLQYERFAAHITNVHSWYKHLSLRFGGHFIVFFDPNAGNVYPSQHPKLPFGNDTENYHKAFGHLSYMYVSNARLKRHYSRDDEDTFREGEVNVKITEELLAHTSFVLYPYINHNGFDSIFNAYIDRQHDIQALRKGEYTLPHQDLFLEFMQNYELTETAYNNLSEQETQLLWQPQENQTEGVIETNPAIQNYELLESQTEETYQQLRQIECEKIILALRNLRKYLEELYNH
ncbi:hypothetical protein BKI52_21905 [marine bacterium AO1-C]|nr:hypothetical protein BKI52_21905 [marine bacterium AO1-C]